MAQITLTADDNQIDRIVAAYNLNNANEIRATIINIIETQVKVHERKVASEIKREEMEDAMNAEVDVTNLII